MENTGMFYSESITDDHFFADFGDEITEGINNDKCNFFCENLTPLELAICLGHTTNEQIEEHFQALTVSNQSPLLTTDNENGEFQKTKGKLSNPFQVKK